MLNKVLIIFVLLDNLVVELYILKSKVSSLNLINTIWLVCLGRVV